MESELLSTQNTQAVERKIRSAFRGFMSVAGCEFRTVYEHGQWWVIWPSSFEDVGDLTFSVVDASGPGSTFGFSFEQV